MSYTKSISPAFTKVGKRKKLTGYLGQLYDGNQLIHSMEYSTNHDAEVALDALVFDLMGNMAGCGLVDDLPIKPCECGKDATWHVAFEYEPRDEFFCDEHLNRDYIADPVPSFAPSTCCFCHKPHSPQSCPDMLALLFAPDAAPPSDPLPDDGPGDPIPGDPGYEYRAPLAQCAYRGCVQYCTHDDTGFCGYHHEEETGLDDDEYSIITPIDVDFAPVGPEA